MGDGGEDQWRIVGTQCTLARKCADLDWSECSTTPSAGGGSPSACKQEGVDALFLAPSADLEYLTGVERQIPNFGEASYAHGWVTGALLRPRRRAGVRLPADVRRVRPARGARRRGDRRERDRRRRRDLRARRARARRGRRRRRRRPRLGRDRARPRPRWSASSGSAPARASSTSSAA